MSAHDLARVLNTVVIGTAVALFVAGATSAAFGVGVTGWLISRVL